MEEKEFLELLNSSSIWISNKGTYETYKKVANKLEKKGYVVHINKRYFNKADTFYIYKMELKSLCYQGSKNIGYFGYKYVQFSMDDMLRFLNGDFSKKDPNSVHCLLFSLPDLNIINKR